MRTQTDRLIKDQTRQPGVCQASERGILNPVTDKDASQGSNPGGMKESPESVAGNQFQDEWNYVYQERLGMMCEDRKPSIQQLACARKEADNHVKQLRLRLAAERLKAKGGGICDERNERQEGREEVQVASRKTNYAGGASSQKRASSNG